MKPHRCRRCEALKKQVTNLQQRLDDLRLQIHPEHHMRRAQAWADAVGLGDEFRKRREQEAATNRTIR